MSVAVTSENKDSDSQYLILYIVLDRITKLSFFIFVIIIELLWTAPEHLRDPFPGTKGSEKGDIYSLAIIMQEVILRVQPYGMLEYKSKGFVCLVLYSKLKKNHQRLCKFYYQLFNKIQVFVSFASFTLTDWKCNMSVLDIAELIQRLRNPPPLIRPKVSPQAAQPQYIVLMKQCWSESPDLRPTIEDIYQQFKSIAGGK